MKPKYLVLFLAAILSVSCMRYQFMSVSSNLPKNSNNLFHENDTCLVSYNFNGENCPLTINITNKLPEPLYVDWKKSTVTIFRDKINLWDDSSPEPNSETVSKILPKASVQVTPFNLITKFVEITPTDSFMSVQIWTDNGPMAMKKFVFDTISTPLHVKCKLHYSAYRSSTEEHYIEDQFWVSSLVSTYSFLPYGQPDIFYLKKTTGFSTFMGIVAIGGLLILNANLPDEGE